MLNLIPHFIHNKYKENIYEGVFSAATLFIDINGFTSMTEKLMYKGKEGAEVLSDILNNMFTPVIKTVYDRSGFVTRFAGDALTIVFHKTDPIKSLFTAMAIRKTFRDYGVQKTRFGEFKLSIKIGLSYGKVQWGIVGEKKNKTFFFKGKAIDGCANAEHLCNKMEIILDNNIYKLLSDKIEINTITENYYKLDKIKELEKPINSELITNVSKNIILDFLPEKLMKFKQKGEFRNVVSVFISFEEKDLSVEINEFVKIVLGKVKAFGGYFNSLDFGDKGSNILIFFGAPVSYEDNIKRAVNFIYTLKSEFIFRAGITYGSVYSGLIGNSIRCTYACLGDIVNLSAKLMMKADFGCIWIAENIADKIGNSFNLKDIGKIKVKGKSEKVKVYEMLDRKHILSNIFYNGEIIGRKSELDYLLKYLKPLYKGNFGGIVYIYGDAGIGKSRLIFEFIEKLTLDCKTYILQTDSILKKSMNPFIYTLNLYFKQDTVKSKEEKKKLFELIYNNLLKNLQNIQDIRKESIILELKRTMTLLGSLIGLKWKNSLYETLDPKGRYENILLSIKEFFKALSLIKPLILILEDLHNLDLDSYSVFENLTKEIEHYPIIILTTSRFNDDGSRPELMLDNKIKIQKIILNNLNRSFVKEIIKRELGKSPDNELLSLILNKTMGNPFYIEQFSLYLKENNLIKIEEKKKQNIYILIKSNIKIPVGISEIIIARIDRLSRDLKEVIQIASVLGREFELKVLIYLINHYLSKVLEKNEFSILVDKVERENIWKSLSDIKYIFNHTLLYETVYDMQLRQNLRILHKLAGVVIENLYRNEEVYFASLAYHFEKAELVEKAIEYLEKAGDYSKDNYDNVEALKYYDRLLNFIDDRRKKIIINNKKGEILELIGKWKDAEKLYFLNIDMSLYIQNKLFLAENKNNLGRILMKKGDYEKAFSFFYESEKLFSELKNIKGIAIVNGLIGQIYLDKGDYKEAMDKFQIKLKLCKELDDEKEIADIVGDIGLVYKRQGNYDLAMECYEKKLIICEKFEDKKEISTAINNMGIIYSNRGNNNKAMECYERKLEICRELGDKHGISVAYNNIGIIYSNKGDNEKAMFCYKRQLEICEELGNKDGIGTALGNIGTVYSDINNNEKAMEFHIKKMKISKELGDKRGISKALGNIGNIYKSLGKYKEAMNCFEQKLKISKYINDLYGISISKSHIAGIYVGKGDFEKAIEYYDDSILIGKKLGIKYYLCNNLYRKANIFFILNKFKQAQKLNIEAIDLAKKAERNEVIFKCEVLNIKIIGIKDKEKAIEIFKNLLEKANETTEIATLNYELFKLSLKGIYKTKAIKLYKELYKKSKNITYKNNIKELKSNKI